MRRRNGSRPHVTESTHMQTFPASRLFAEMTADAQTGVKSQRRPGIACSGTARFGNCLVRGSEIGSNGFPSEHPSPRTMTVGQQQTPAIAGLREECYVCPNEDQWLQFLSGRELSVNR